jgi:hypothetical protein
MINKHLIIFSIVLASCGQTASPFKKELTSECDCKKYAVDNKIQLPEASDLYLLNDSMLVDESQIIQYRETLKKVNEIRANYDVQFKKCYEKFYDLNIVKAGCSKDEIAKKAFGDAISLMRVNCRGSNQDLARYMATKVNGTVVFMFMSVAQNGMVCITGISELNPNEILSTDCGEANEKIAEWEAIQEYKIKQK